MGKGEGEGEGERGGEEEEEGVGVGVGVGVGERDGVGEYVWTREKETNGRVEKLLKTFVRMPVVVAVGGCREGGPGCVGWRLM